MSIKTNKKSLEKIYKLEKKYYIENFNKDEYAINFLEILENLLNREIRNRIDLKSIKKKNKDELEREILKTLSVEELKIIVYCENKEETE